MVPFVSDEHNDDVAFEDLANLKDIQRLQDEFALASGVASIIERLDGTPITSPSNFSRLYNDIISKTENGGSGFCKVDSGLLDLNQDGPAIKQCLSSGLWYAGAAIFVGGTHIANWLIGQVRDESLTEADIRKYAREMGASEAECLEAYSEIPVITREQFANVAQVLFTLANQLSSMAYQNIQQKNLIDQYRQAEEKLKSTTSFLDTIVDMSPFAMWVAEPDGTIVRSNHALREILNLNDKQLLGKYNVLDDANLKTQNLTSMVRDVFEKHKAVHFNTLWRAAEVKYPGLDEDLDKYISVSMFPILSEEGELENVVCQWVDITERKNAEDELRKARNYIANIVDSMPSVLVGVDSEGRVTQWNKSAEDTTGIEASMAQGKTLSEVFPRMASEMARISDSIKTRQVQREEKKPHKIEGGVCYEDITIYPLVANGVEGAVVRIDDVTERVRMEEMMIQSEKMLSVGGLAAGMAHEINNPLAAMVQTADVLALRLSSGKIAANIAAAEAVGTTMEVIDSFMSRRGVHNMLTAIKESGSRAASIVNNMLSFARQSDAHFSPHVVSNLLDKTIELASADYNLEKQYDFKTIKIFREYESDLPAVSCEPGKIQQVLLNILRNGAEAMQDAETRNPRFTIRTKHEKSQRTVRIEIEDNGPGVDTETQKRLFEPFFTTKPAGSGTGLGLSVSYFIIKENHGGELSVESQPGKGTNFIIRLPLDSKENE